MFTSRGNYGSTVYDGPYQIENYLCDQCFVDKAEEKAIIQIKEKSTIHMTKHIFELDKY